MSLDDYDDDVLIERLEEDGYLVIITAKTFQERQNTIYDDIAKLKLEGNSRLLKCYQESLARGLQWYDEDSLKMLEEIKSRGFTITDRYGNEV
jgi:hypothetical protein